MQGGTGRSPVPPHVQCAEGSEPVGSQPIRRDCIDIFNKALEHNIGITPGILFSATRRFRNHLRINCGFPWTEANVNALKTLGQIVGNCRGA